MCAVRPNIWSLRSPHYENGIYVIITVETFSEDELDLKMEQLDELCSAAGAVDVLEADERFGICAATVRSLYV